MAETDDAQSESCPDAPEPVDAETQDPGISLDQLSEAFAELLGTGDATSQDESDADETAGVDEAGDSADALLPEELTPALDLADRTCPVSPRSILEAALFVGRADNEPHRAVDMAAVMRGVDSREIDALVRELNDQYEAAGQAYYIASVGPGYQMKLRGQFDSLTNRFYGRIREARLSQAAIDVLAIVAYNQPIVRVEVDRLRDRSSSAILSQLVRRRLLRIERSDDKPPAVRYFTTDRFLELFGLENLESLPRSQDIDSVP